METSTVLFVCAALCLLHGSALPLFSQNPSSKQQQAEAHAAKAREFLRTNQPGLAVRELGAIVALDPSNADAHANLGVLVFFQQDYAKAAPELRQAVKLRPDLWKIEALLGLCEKRLGDVGSATQHLERAFPKLEEEKLKVQAGMELTELYYAAKDLDKATSAINVLRRVRPTDPDILYTAHRIYTDLADESILSLAMSAPDSARTHQAMANQMARRGNRNGAIEQYRKAIQTDPRLPNIHFQLAEALNGSAAANEQAEAEKEYEAAVAENPLDAKAQSRLGEIAYGRSDLKIAADRYTRALKLQPGDPDANLGLAKVLTETGQSAKAERFLLRAKESEPFDPVTHMRLATLYRETGRASEAAKELAEFRRLKDLKDRLKDVYQDRRLRPPEK